MADVRAPISNDAPTSAPPDKGAVKMRGDAAKKTKPSHSRHKRPPKRLSQRPNDIYVNRSSQFGAQLARCHKLFDQGEVTVHGLGAAIHRAINLALQLKDTSSVPMEMSVTTSTVELVDDMEPLHDDADYQTLTRPNSAIHIRLCKVSPSASSPPVPTTPPSNPLTQPQPSEGGRGTSRVSKRQSSQDASHRTSSSKPS